MKVYRISKCQYINDLSGTGAALYGGRWNSKGTYILYTAASPSLALLETVVHMTGIAAASFCILCISLPDAAIDEIALEDLPNSWQSNPPDENLKSFGDEFIRKGTSLGLKLPSVIMPEEFNVLLNPHHQDMKKLKIEYVKQLPLDKRLLHS